MRNPTIALIVFAIAIPVFSLIYIWNPPIPRYYPIEHEWHIIAASKNPAMAWYGRSAAALAAGCLAGAIGYAVARSLASQDTRPLSATTTTLLTIVILASLTITVARVVHEQQSWFHRAPTPPKPDHEY